MSDEIGSDVIEWAKDLARTCAKAKPESYYAEPFEPHAWVVDAIIAAKQQTLAKQSTTDAEWVEYQDRIGEVSKTDPRLAYLMMKVGDTLALMVEGQQRWQAAIKASRDNPDGDGKVATWTCLWCGEIVPSDAKESGYLEEHTRECQASPMVKTLRDVQDSNCRLDARAMELHQIAMMLYAALVLTGDACERCNLLHEGAKLAGEAIAATDQAIDNAAEWMHHIPTNEGNPNWRASITEVITLRHKLAEAIIMSRRGDSKR